MVRALLIAAFLMINLTCTEAIGDMNVCYILDGILICYGIVLTVLYYRLRMSPCQRRPARAPAKNSEKKPVEGGIYAGLTCQTSDFYETIKMDKKPIV